MRGVSGVVRILAHFRENVLPFDLPIYINKARIDGDVPDAGDVIHFGGMMYVDSVEGEVDEKDFLEKHPDGLSIPREIVPGALGNE